MKQERLGGNRFVEQLQLSTMALPAVILILIFSYIPMFGLIIAFKNYKVNLGILGSEFVGLKNFMFFFHSNDAFRIIRNTLCYNAVFITVGVVFSVSFAIMLSTITQKKLIKFYQSSMFLPYFLSWVVVAYMSLCFFNYKDGILNGILKALRQNAVSWYSEPKYWPFILVISYLWKTAGYNVLIYYAAIISIDEVLYEAAYIDGCTKFKSIWHITIPNIRPTVVILVILSIGRIFYADFGLFYQLTQNSGSLYSVTDVVDTYVYRTLRVTGDVGVSAAVGFVQSIVGFALQMTTNFVVGRIDEDYKLI